MNIKKLNYLIPLLLLGCNESATITQNCPEGQKLFNGACYDNNVCLPFCNEVTHKCIEGVCYEKSACVPACGAGLVCDDGTCRERRACNPACDSATQVCDDGRCVDVVLCDPECSPDEMCVAGTCQPKDPTACSGKLCKDQRTYCDDTGHWNECAIGTGCHLGVCLKGLGPECEDNTCSEDGTSECQGGTWVDCGSLEECKAGKCTITDEQCVPKTCSEDANYRCTDEEKYEACAPGQTCKNGVCDYHSGVTEALLWQTCSKNSDCAHGICVFEISTSRTMSVTDLELFDVDLVPVSSLDSRIPAGVGVCSQDCTRDAAICDAISSDTKKFTCQVMVTGDSPYPPKDLNGLNLSLPFHKELVVGDMKIAPFASLCRPNDALETWYSKTFCKACTGSEECGESESCVNGACLIRCGDNKGCPMGFTCAPGDGTEALFCRPNSGTCEACLDRDGDGQGFGACKVSGYDCDDASPDIYYDKTLEPTSCTTNVTDDNCNGHIDFTELIGSPDNCAACGSTCKVAENANHIDRQCVLHNGDKALDDSSPEAISQTYAYACDDYCELGYADCDADVSNGCETRLFEVDGEEIKLTADGEKYSLDSDGDGHGVINVQSEHYCCKNNASDNPVCYAMPKTDLNQNDYWDRIELKQEHQYSTQMDDCDDTNAVRYPGHAEICDGFDNDCNDETPDGKDVFVKLSNFEYVETDESDADKKALNDKCDVYEASAHTKCSEKGQITCQSEASDNGTSYRMICKAEQSDKDESCNGIDDNCNGQLDEDYKFKPCPTGMPGICSMGVEICSGGAKSCIQLYQARDYDFYGDGVDSNCDGVDWDATNAVFVDKYGTTARSGNDSHSGKADGPVATLKRAFQIAVFNPKSDPSKVYYHDIIVSKDVDNLSDSYALWGKEPILIPTVAPDLRFVPALKPADAIPGASLSSDAKLEDYHDAHVLAYQAKLRNESGYADYLTNDYLYPGEVYPGKALVRIIGGFTNTDGTWENKGGSSEYKYLLNSTNTTVKDSMLQGSHYEIVKPDGSDPMSLQLKQFALTIMADAKDGIFGKLTGTTLIGLTCGKNGCDYLDLDKSTITVTAPTGFSQTGTEHPSNNIWYNERNGVTGDYWKIGNGGGTAHTTNYWANNCMQVYFNNGWKSYKSFSTDYYDQQCPDGRTPRGGCGASHCCKNHCGDYAKQPDGQWGRGPNGGDYANPSCNKSSGCGNDNSVSDKQPKGGVGGNGAGGAGGSNQNLSIRFSFDNAGDTYLATYSYNRKDSIDASNGVVGTSGGGGGGGGIYHCYDLNTTDDHWAHAGSGGAGGCGGHAGKGGGTGGSAIGIILTPPKDKAITAYYNATNASISVAGAQGGTGSSGQGGQAGGQGGGSFGWAEKSWLGYDQHCIKGTAGGAGGAGGGGGGGAAGMAGQAYGALFVCNRGVNSFSSIDSDLEGCGMVISQNFYNTATNASATTAKNGKDGTAGTSGSWDEAHNGKQTGVNRYANWKSVAGKAGSGAVTFAEDGRTVARAYQMSVTDAF